MEPEDVMHELDMEKRQLWDAIFALQAEIRELKNHQHYQLSDKIDQHIMSMTPHRFGQ